MSITDQNRPLRVFDKILKGGLGAGNLGIIMSRHGTGKTAILTSIAIDHAMSGVNTLHACVGKSIDEVRAYDDEVLQAMISAHGIKDQAQVMTNVERHKQIYTYGDGDMTVERLRTTLVFLAEHAQFKPGLVELQAWPDFEKADEQVIKDLKALAVEFETEIWMSAHTHRNEDEGVSVPDYVKRFDSLISVMVALEPKSDEVFVRFLKTHDFTPPEVNLQFSPTKLLLRWR
ncbi:MAG: hypothetical protein ACI97A_001295 [Planctomycetota bacterium]|jgi:hypothetical protein